MNLSLTLLDWLVVLIVVVSAGYAAWRGFLLETLTIFAWVAAAFACLYFGPFAISFVREWVRQAWLASLLAYAGVFLGVLIPLAFISRRFSQGVKNSPIGALDRVAGIGFGVVRGLVLVGLAYLAFTYFVPIRSQPHWVRQARLLPLVQSTADVLLTVIPTSHKDGDAEDVRQELPQSGRNARNQPDPSARHDPMAELIRRNEAANSVHDAREPAPQKKVARGAKSYGASDRQALDRLVETGGSGKP